MPKHYQKNPSYLDFFSSTFWHLLMHVACWAPKIYLLLSKWGYFWEVRAIWLVLTTLKACLRVELWFSIPVTSYLRKEKKNLNGLAHHSWMLQFAWSQSVRWFSLPLKLYFLTCGPSRCLTISSALCIFVLMTHLPWPLPLTQRGMHHTLKTAAVEPFLNGYCSRCQFYKSFY